VLDISDPFNPVKVGEYDTYAAPTPTYNGAWGCYPFFPSGNVVISDMSTGLYIFDFILDNPLPVELTSFEYMLNKNTVKLIWQTASELNSYGFEIERKIISETNKDSDWEVIGFMQGQGTSSVGKDYSYLDIIFNSGKYLYRLKQIDIDGTVSHSKIVEVNYLMPVKFYLSQNFPNPFNPSTKIKFSIPSSEKADQLVTLKIYDMLGNEVALLLNESKTSGDYEIDFNAEGLSSGVYIAKLTAGSYSDIIKMNLLK
jgi:hypothetical protein